MSKYIPADKLIAEIERLNSLVSYEREDRHDDGLHDAYKAVKNVITSIQQEQTEVDLEKEIDHYLYGENFVRKYDGVYVPGARMRDWKNPNVGKTLYGNELTQFARNFYELGFNARKEE